MMCSMCRYFNDMDLTCNRFPPQYCKGLVDGYWSYPRVTHTQSCGEYASVEEKQGDDNV